MSDIPAQVSDLMDPREWRAIDGFPDSDITYHRWVSRSESGEQDLPAVRIAFNRPEVRNAFRPQTVDELYRAIDHARQTVDVAAIILTGNGPAADGVHAFCSGAISASAAATATSTKAPQPTLPRTAAVSTSSRSSASCAPRPR
ncbi:hypothetical protein GCM10025873_25320 [Demequina sediminis]|nr:hypothetical protein GCM10025873_25320 [Demequina sediminis]